MKVLVSSETPTIPSLCVLLVLVLCSQSDSVSSPPLRIMMLSVLKNTKTPVKFWFLKNYLSPTFKVGFLRFLPLSSGFFCHSCSVSSEHPRLPVYSFQIIKSIFMMTCKRTNPETNCYNGNCEISQLDLCSFCPALLTLVISNIHSSWDLHV